MRLDDEHSVSDDGSCLGGIKICQLLETKGITEVTATVFQLHHIADRHGMSVIAYGMVGVAKRIDRFEVIRIHVAVVHGLVDARIDSSRNLHYAVVASEAGVIAVQLVIDLIYLYPHCIPPISNPLSPWPIMISS